MTAAPAAVGIGPDLRRRLHDELALASVHRHLPIVAAASVVNALAMGLYAVAGGATPLMFGWVVALIATSALAWTAHRSGKLLQADDLSKVRRLLMLRCAVVGCLWGGFCGHVAYLGGPTEQTVALLMITGTAAGTALTYLRLPICGLALIAPMMALGWIGYAVAAPSVALYMAPVFLAYFLVLAGVTRLGSRLFSDYVDSLAALKTQARRMAALEDERAALMTTLSQDMRTPLHQILGFSDVLRRTAEDDKRKTDAEHARFVCEAAEALQRHVGRALDLRRLSAASAELKPTAVDIVAATQDAALEAEAKAATRDQIVAIVAPRSGLVIETDEDALRTILLCLIE
ncbi:MAG: histidine kinase dimerization/phospho-acceptor domain-containing protein, partial [Pseudomonadota bacterium]